MSSSSLLLWAVSLVSVFSLVVSQPTLTVVSTTRDTQDRLTPQAPIPFSQQQPGGDILTLYPSIQFQQILGFGGALTEAAASVWLKLPAELQTELIQAYYNSTHGHGYNCQRSGPDTASHAQHLPPPPC